MNSDKAYFLSKVEFLSDLKPAELAELAEEFQWHDFVKGSAIIQKGQKPQWFYILTKGHAEVLVTKKGQSSWPVNSFGPGDAFGEIALFTGERAPTTIRCLEDCRVLLLDAAQFSQMLQRWPKLYHRFIEKLSHSLNNANNVLWEAKHREFMRSTLQLTQYEDKFYGIWGSTKTTAEVESKLKFLVDGEEHILLIGERGTGRQMMAWYLHKHRFGDSAPFIVVEGRNFDRQWGERFFETEQESNGSITGGTTLLDIAAGGTLLIREIELISPRAQEKLAQALAVCTHDCLVIGSLQSDPDALPQPLNPKLRQFFEQTYTITPLRDRKRDIPVLVRGILQKLAKKHNRPVPVLDPEATKLLLSHNYRQGNVTELIQVIERSFFLAENNLISLEHIFFGPTAKQMGRTIDLLGWAPLAKVLKKGSVVKVIRWISAVMFLAIILLLFLAPASPLGQRVFMSLWGVWWLGLVLISPFVGRIWCTVCPFSTIMNLVQTKFHLNRPVPDFLKKYDYIIITVLFLLIFWVEILSGMRSSPLYTIVLLLSIQLAAITCGIVFTRDAWCSHLCPLGGFVGMASIGSMLEIRADAAVCLNKCTTLDCYRGSAEAPGCPMAQHLPYLDNNIACKLCFNCVRNCPNSSVKLNLRFPAREVWHMVRVNQGFVLFTIAALAILVPIQYFEHFHSSKFGLWFSLTYWGTALVSGLLTWLLAQPFKTKAASRRIKVVFSMIPLVLAGHIIYRLGLLPGINSILLGLGIITSKGQVHTFYLPAYNLGLWIAAFTGTVLSLFSISMVLLRTRSAKSAVNFEDTGKNA